MVAAITPGSFLTDKVLFCRSLSEFFRGCESVVRIGRFPVFTV